MNLTDLLSSGSRHKWVVDNSALASFLKENTQVDFFGESEIMSALSNT